MSELEIDASLAPEPVAAPVAEPVAEVAPEPVADVAAEPEPEPEPVAAAEPEPARKHTGAVAELIENRRLLKETKERLSAYENDPALQRLTPEVRQAILDGRVQVRPQTTQADSEKERLTQVAHDLGLLKADNTPDLDAAARVDRYVTGTVRQAVAPIQSMTLRDKAQANVNGIWAQMAEQKVPEDAIAIVRKEFETHMRMHGAEAMLSQPEVVESVYNAAIGKAVRAGKWTAAAAPVKAPAVAAIPSPATGKRGVAAAAVQLTPAQQAVYKSHGMDPNKAYSATTELKYDKSGNIELE